MRLLSDDRIFIKILFLLAVASGISYVCVLLITQELKLFSVTTPAGNPFTFAMDYLNYLNATSASLKGENPYLYTFKYFPFVIFFFYPFAFLSFVEGYLVMFAINILLLLVTVTFISRLLHFYGVTFKLREKLFLFFAILFFYPWLSNLIAGQVGNIAMLCFLSIFLYYAVDDTTRKGPYLSSCALLVATFLKAFPAILVVFEIYLKKWKNVAIFCAFLLVIVTVSIIALGIPIYIDYLRTLTSYQGWTTQNGSVFAIMEALGGLFQLNSATTKSIWIVICVLSALLLIYYVLKQTRLLSRRSDEIDILVFSAITLIAIAFPFFSQPTYVVILIPSFLLFVYRFALTGVEKVTLMLCLMLLAFPMHVWYVAKLLDGAFFSFANAVSTTSIGLLLMLVFVAFRLQTEVIRRYNHKELSNPAIQK